jgi:pentachlorophenol monooxygenase
MTTRTDRKVQVLVVGAGPVGLTAALCASRRGLKVEVVDQTYRGWARGHAALLHPSSVKALRELGLSDVLARTGHSIRGVVVHVDQAPVLRLELPSPALSMPQTAVETALLKVLRADGVPIRAPFQATSIQQDRALVKARVVRLELVELGSPATYSDWQPLESSLVEADFLIGADGYDSRVRASLGIETKTVGETEAFAMFEAPVPVDLGSDLHLAFTDGLGSVVVPLANSRARFGFQLATDLDAAPGIERLKALLAARIPWFQEPVDHIDWGTVIHFERRLVRSFGDARVWLAGDAAHVTNPLGAQSMNTGIAEAHDLVEAIGTALTEKGGLDPLVNYGQTRQREWRKLLGFDVKFELMRHAPVWLAAHARRIAPALPLSGRDLQKTLRELGLEIA